MKILIIIVSVAIIIFIGYQAYSNMSTTGTEKQKYKVLKKYNDIEIRMYGPSILASVTLNGNYDQISGDGFRILANYIFGGNKAQQKIAMTSPVHMDLHDSSTTMSFVMPSQYAMDNLPAPSNEMIQLNEISNQTVAAIQFGGYASTDKINLKIDELREFLEDKGISYYGDFKFMGYNPPFQVVGRRNEVVVKINF